MMGLRTIARAARTIRDAHAGAAAVGRLRAKELPMALDAACPKCGFKYAWDGSSCRHCDPPSVPATASPRRFVRRLTGLLILIGLAVAICLACWPGRFSYFNIWLIRSGMTLEQVEWLLGSAGEQLTEKELLTLQGGQKVVSGERFYRWHADPKGFWQGDYNPSGPVGTDCQSVPHCLDHVIPARRR